MGTPLPPDSPDGYESDLMAMRADAAQWAGAAERMAGAAAAARQLVLGDYELSLFGAQTGLTGAYQEIQQWTSGLLSGAQSNLAAMGEALKTSADTYAAQEASGTRSFNELDQGGN